MLQKVPFLRLQVAYRLTSEPKAFLDPSETTGLLHLIWARSGEGELATIRPQEAYGVKPEDLEDVDNPGIVQVVRDLEYEVQIPKWALLWGWLSPSGPVNQCPRFVVEAADRILTGNIRRFRVADYPN